MTERRAPNLIGVLFLLACLPPVAYGVMGGLRFLGAGPDWTGLGLASAMVLLAMGALAVYRRGHRLSALVLLVAAWAPLLMALLVMVALNRF